MQFQQSPISPATYKAAKAKAKAKGYLQESKDELIWAEFFSELVIAPATDSLAQSEKRFWVANTDPLERVSKYLKSASGELEPEYLAIIVSTGLVFRHQEYGKTTPADASVDIAEMLDALGNANIEHAIGGKPFKMCKGRSELFGDPGITTAVVVDTTVKFHSGAIERGDGPVLLPSPKVVEGGSISTLLTFDGSAWTTDADAKVQAYYGVLIAPR